MSQIQVESTGSGTFQVTLQGGGTHTVTVGEDTYQELTGGKISMEELVRRSFEFLLQREPASSILSRFDLRVISQYFPEYDQAMRDAVAGG